MFSMRALVIGMFVLATSAFATNYTYYEDDFDAGSLNPAWTSHGTGTYSFVDSDIEFVTQPGDLIYDAEDEYGFPQHLFTVDVPGDCGLWSAVARVRYNTPDERYEQVDLIAYSDDDNFMKLSYEQGTYHAFQLLGETDATGYIVKSRVEPAMTDYFWLRLDRVGSVYTGYFSTDLTTDPDAVSWSPVGSLSAQLASPQVGFGGWNYTNGPSGELAEFDYFRLQVPEPASLLALLGVVGLVRRR